MDAKHSMYLETFTHGIQSTEEDLMSCDLSFVTLIFITPMLLSDYK